MTTTKINIRGTQTLIRNKSLFEWINDKMEMRMINDGWTVTSQENRHLCQ